MSDYEYDTGATRLVISEGLNIRDDKHFVVVSAEHLKDVNVSVAVQDEDAPAVALAILEAADVGKLGKVRLVAALSQLTQYQEDRQREAEREAEDAKVVEFRDASLAAVCGYFGSSQDEWNALTDTGREGWRARYRAARKFFTEES